MRTYMRIAVLFAVVILLLLVLSLYRRASAPESTIILKEKNRFTDSIDRTRLVREPVYAVGVRNKLRTLSLSLAMAYNKENKPDQAIEILKKLIEDEQAASRVGDRRAMSYLHEAGFYEALETSYLLKNDRAGAERAEDIRNELLAKAEAAKRKERLEEGKSIGVSTE